MKPISDKPRDFTGQNIYVGMDVHDKSWKMHIYSDEFELNSFSHRPDKELDELRSYCGIVPNCYNSECEAEHIGHLS